MKKALRILANVFAWVVLILAFLVTLIVFSSGRNNGVANLLGYMPLTVESDSMSPTFKKDDMIICKDIDDVYSLQEGDVITFWTIIEGQRVKNTHRIASINDAEGVRSFVTRGDANALDDELPAYAGDLIGQWTGIKLGGLGKAMSFLRTRTGFFVCILIPMALFFLLELYKFIVTLIEAKRPEIPEIDEEEIKRRAIEEYLASQKQAAEQAAAAPEVTAAETQKDAAQAEEEPSAASETETAAAAEEKTAEAIAAEEQTNAEQTAAEVSSAAEQPEPEAPAAE